ncbi:MAG: M28 family peptidase, partial [Bacteroidota bacterium]
ALKVAYPSRGNFIAVVGKLGQGNWVRHVKKHMKAASDLPVHSINAPASIPGIDFSDHLNYWNEGYRALMITNTSFYRNKNYHQASDTPETLDYGRMGEVVKGVYWAMANVKT